MKKLLAILLTVISIGAWAGNSSDAVNGAGFSRLTEAEKAEVIKLVADKAANKEVFAPGVPVEDRVEKWVKIGSNIGQGLAGAAKEIGVTVNDFANTPVGKMTTLLIVWHMIGNQLLHVIGGLLVWLAGFSILWHMIRRAYPETLTYSKEVKNIFGNFVVTERKKIPMDDGNAAGWLFAFGVIMVAGIVVMFTGR